MAKVDIKAPIVDEIKATIDGAASVVLVDYLGLTVEQDTKLRKNLRAEEITYKVYKNTLIIFINNKYFITSNEIFIRIIFRKCPSFE